PVQLQTVAIGAAESGAAAVVYVEHRNAAAGPILNVQIERARGGRRWPAVALDQKRRPLLCPRGIVTIAGRGEHGEGRFPARGREFHAFDPREVISEMQVRTIENVGRLLQHGVPTGREIKCHDAGGMLLLGLVQWEAYLPVTADTLSNSLTLKALSTALWPVLGG